MGSELKRVAEHRILDVVIMIRSESEQPHCILAVPAGQQLVRMPCDINILSQVSFDFEQRLISLHTKVGTKKTAGEENMRSRNA